MFSKKAQWIIFATVNGLVILAVLLFPLYLKVVDFLPTYTCGAVRYFEIYCPACGGTRALKALLSLNFAESLHYNPIILLGLLLFLAYEVGMIVCLIRGKERKTLWKPWIVDLSLIFVFGYAIVRNILLAYGIDLIGDIL